MNWKLIANDPPPVNQDILIYSAKAKGYGVAITELYGGFRVYKNSTTGGLFQPPPTHWTELPPPPTFHGISGLPSVSQENN